MEFIVHKGGALAPLLYERTEDRPMVDIDILIRPEDWEKVKEKIETDYVGNCDGCYLTLHVNEHGNLAIACVNDNGCRGDEDCCLDVTYMEGRGHRAACACHAKD